MEQSNKWNSIALNGLILAMATIVLSLVSSILTPTMLVSALIWIVKFGATNFLLYYFMKQYSETKETISYGESFNYGFLVSVASAIVCACYMFISLNFLFVEQTATLVDTLKEAFAAQNLNSDQEEQINKWMDRLPELMLFFTLIYYPIYGAIASSIIANSTKKVNPFAGDKID